MMKRKWFPGALVLALVLFLNMSPMIRAAETDVEKLSMTAPHTAVNDGDAVAVTIASPRTFVTCGAGITIAYDAAVLEPVIAGSRVKEGFRLSGPMTVNGKTGLRISSFPGDGGHTVEAGEPLAVLAFRVKAPSENTAVEMIAAYLYDEALAPVSLQSAEAVNINVAAVSVTGITLEMDALELEIGESRILKAAVQPETASDKTIIWSSSDETKVTVIDGVLTGLAITEAPVTVTASAGGFTAQCSVNVAYPPDAGYVITMPADQTVLVGETVTISPVIGNAQNVSIYNAYDITLSYLSEYTKRLMVASKKVILSLTRFVNLLSRERLLQNLQTNLAMSWQ